MAAIKKLEEQLSDLQDVISDGDWVPVTGTGKQLSPNQIRSQIIKYCADEGISLNVFRIQVDVNGNSWNKFMNAKYKDPWSAVDNQSYWAAAQFLEKYKLKKKIEALKARHTTTKTAKSKRTLDDSDKENMPGNMLHGCVGGKKGSATGNAGDAKRARVVPAKKSKKQIQEELVARIAEIDLPEDGPVYDNCDIVRGKVRKFLIEHGFSQGGLAKVLGVNGNSMTNFMKQKGKLAGAGNVTFPKAYRFFEQKRILDKKPKSGARVKTEAAWGEVGGYPLKHDTGIKGVWCLPDEDPKDWDPRIWDVEYTALNNAKRELAKKLSPEDRPSN
mmetsp:Transcript_7465/g.13209  ORF Transcript_7465/g.13209 Transcript_7465/m.13209 type:complete len:330 (+) Transcript_7465:54-1043(+)